MLTVTKTQLEEKKQQKLNEAQQAQLVKLLEKLSGLDSRIEQILVAVVSKFETALTAVLDAPKPVEKPQVNVTADNKPVVASIEQLRTAITAAVSDLKTQLIKELKVLPIEPQEVTEVKPVQWEFNVTYMDGKVNTVTAKPIK